MHQAPAASPEVQIPAAMSHTYHREPCFILAGWKQRDGVVREISPSGVLVGGVVGLRVGDPVTVFFSDRLAVSLAARVKEISIHGARLQPDEPVCVEEWHRNFLEVVRRVAR